MSESSTPRVTAFFLLNSKKTVDEQLLKGYSRFKVFKVNAKER